jgi:hypothetical protein
MLPPSPRKYWTRRDIGEWLVERLAEGAPTLVGIDHGFPFPLRYYESHIVKPDWPVFLDNFQRRRPSDGQGVWGRDVRNGAVGIRKEIYN